MRRKLLAVASALVLVAMTSPSSAVQAPAAAPALVPATYLQAGRVLADPSSGRVLSGKTIVVRDGKVEAILDGFVPGKTPDDHVVDLHDQFVLPGLIDAHTHILSSPGSQSIAGAVLWSDARWALQAIPNLRTMLEGGFTTIRDVGSFNGAIYDLRRAVAEGLVDGPEIIAVREMLTPTGGHGDQLPLRPEVTRPEQLSTCDGPIECRKRVRQIARNGADLIKIKVTGGALSGSGLTQDNVMFDDEVREVVRTAHAENLRVAAHALTGESSRIAVAAGVDSLEHGQGMDAETVRLMRQMGTYFVPTLAAARLVGEMGDPHGDAGAVFASGVYQRAAAAARLAQRSGVTFVFGTDVGVIPLGSVHSEFNELSEIGLSPLEAIQAATSNAARLLKREGKIGVIAVGSDADVVAFAGDPLKDLGVLSTPSFVMSNGHIHTSAGGRP